MALRTILARPTTSPFSLALASVLASISAVFDLYHYFIYISPVYNPSLGLLAGLSLTLTFAILALSLSYPMQDIRPSPTVSPVWAPPSRSYSSPEDSVTLWNWMTFDYIKPLLDRAGEGTLNEEDVWDLPPGFKHANLFGKYLRVTEKDKKEGKKTSLVWFLLSSNSQDLIIDISLKTWNAVIGMIYLNLLSLTFTDPLYPSPGFVPPYALSRILSSLENHEDKTGHADAYFFALITFLAHISFAQLDLLQGWHSRRAYERARGQLFCALHWKALKAKDSRGKISEKASKEEGDVGDSKAGDKKKKEEENESSGIGRITNLMSWVFLLSYELMYLANRNTYSTSKTTGETPTRWLSDSGNSLPCLLRLSV